MVVLTVNEIVSGVKMIFTHDVDLSLSMAAALVNTAATGEHGDGLDSVADLDAFRSRWDDSGTRVADSDDLDDVTDLRTALREAWTAPEERAVALVNALLARGSAPPQLVRHDGFGWHVHATTAEERPSTRLRVEIALALVDVVRAGELPRLGTCARPGCGHVLADLSRNRSRRFCDEGCANRSHAAAYRARRAAVDEG